MPGSRIASLVLVALIAASACGGSSYKGLPKAEYVTQVDAICTTYNVRLSDAVKAAGSDAQTDPQKTAALVLDKLIPLYREQITELKKPKPPKEDRATIDKVFGLFSGEVDKAEAAFKADPAAAMKGQGNVFAESSAAAKAYGLNACGD